MKKLTKRLVHVPSWSRIALVCLFSLQIIKTVSSSTESTKESTNNDERQVRSLKIETESTDSCPMCNLSEMPMELAEKINEISDVDVFIHDYVDDTNSLSNVSSLYTHPANRKRRAASTQLRQATCQPVDTLISLVPKDERDPTIFYFPSCVIVKQCGGCCAHSGTTCTPTDETDKEVTVKKTKFVNEPKLANLGDVTMAIKEHNKCKCLCKKTASDCNSLQKFIRSQCRCECLNYKEADQCAQNPKKLFDTNSCACVCRDTKYCEQGLRFDQETCSCQPITDTTPEEEEYPITFGEHFINETFEATDDNKYETESITTTSE